MDQDDRDRLPEPAWHDAEVSGSQEDALGTQGRPAFDEDEPDLGARDGRSEVPQEDAFLEPPVGEPRRVAAPVFDVPHRRGPFRDWTRKDVLRAVAVVIAAAVFLLPVTLLLSKSREDAAAAAKQADGYKAPSLDLASGKRYTGPVVAIVADESALRSASGVGKADRWPALLGESLDSAIDVVPVENGGYASTGTDGVTYLNAASGIPADADVVLFVGGSNDAGASAVTLGRAATNSMSAAAERAPGSAVAMVGPIITDGLSSTRITAVQTVLQRAASTAGVQWVDPTAARWLPTPRTRGTDLTAADEQKIAARMASLVTRLAG